MTFFVDIFSQNTRWSHREFGNQAPIIFRVATILQIYHLHEYFDDYNSLLCTQIKEGDVLCVAGGLMVEHPLTSPFVEAVVGFLLNILFFLDGFVIESTCK